MRYEAPDVLPELKPSAHATKAVAVVNSTPATPMPSGGHTPNSVTRKLTSEAAKITPPMTPANLDGDHLLGARWLCMLSTPRLPARHRPRRADPDTGQEGRAAGRLAVLFAGMDDVRPLNPDAVGDPVHVVGHRHTAPGQRDETLVRARPVDLLLVLHDGTTAARFGGTTSAFDTSHRCDGAHAMPSRCVVLHDQHTRAAGP